MDTSLFLSFFFQLSDFENIYDAYNFLFLQSFVVLLSLYLD